MDEDNSNSIVDDITRDKQERASEDIDNILEEFPVEKSKSNQVVEKPQTNPAKDIPKKKKFRLFKKKPSEQSSPQPKPYGTKKSKFRKMLPFIILLVGMLIVAFTINPPSNCSQECPETTEDTSLATKTLVDSIQNQIISKGYAEVVSGDVTLKLAPYTG